MSTSLRGGTKGIRSKAAVRSTGVHARNDGLWGGRNSTPGIVQQASREELRGVLMKFLDDLLYGSAEFRVNSKLV